MNAKKLLLIACCLLGSISGRAETTKVNLWNDPAGKTIGTSWTDAGYVIITADKAAAIVEGDVLSVSVSEINAECANAQILLQRAWGNFSPSQQLSLVGKDAPYEARFTITESMVEELANNGSPRALQVKGLGYTMTSIDLIHEEGTKSGETVKIPANLWEGSQLCSDSWSGYLKLTPSQIGNVSAGDFLEITVSSISATSTYPQLVVQNGNWTDFDDISPVALKNVQLPYVAKVNITESMAAEINRNGIVVKGCGFTFVKVDIVREVELYEDTKAPRFLSEIDRSCVKAYLPGEEISYGFTLRGLHVSDIENLPVSISVSTDQGEKVMDFNDTVTLKARAENTDYIVTIPESSLSPGFYKVSATAGKVAIGSFTIGYDPENIDNPVDCNDDFNDYWTEALGELAAVDPCFTMEEIAAGGSAARKIYKVSMYTTPDEEGGEPELIRGYYAEPVAAGVYPVLIQFQGTDGGTGDVKPMDADSNPGWCEFILSTRGQKLNRVEDPASWEKYGGDFYSFGLMDFHSHYYRGAYLDCVRAVDFIYSCCKADKRNIFATGMSQGGSFCYAAAALDNRITGIAPAITGHSDFRANVNIVSWPGNKFDAYLKANPQISREELFDFLSYFDVKNFAPMIKCPVITAFSLQDTTDPPRGNIAPFNLVSTPLADKEYIVNPFLGHSTHASWADDYMRFFKSHINSATGAIPVTDGSEDVDISISDGSININGAENKEVSLYNISGNMIFNSRNFNGNAIAVVCSGIYLVKIGSEVYKIKI